MFNSDPESMSGLGQTGEGRTSGARDVASATQAERCALHHHACPVFVGRSACRTQQRKGGKPSRYSYWLYPTVVYRFIKERGIANTAGWRNNGKE